jgi:hypothetical protein
MNTFIIIATTIVGIIGLYLSINTIIETRNKYYKDYLNRKRNEKT